MYIKTKLILLSIAFFGLTSTLVAKADPNSIDAKYDDSTLVAKADPNSIDAKYDEDAKYDNYKEIFHKLCPIISQFPGLRDLKDFRIRNQITDKRIEAASEETRIIFDKPKSYYSTYGSYVASRIEEYTRLIRILLESLNKKESTAVLEAINVCDQFRDKAISEWNEPKGTVTQEEFKQKLEEIYKKHETEIESQKKEYRDIKELLSNGTEKTDQQISSIEQDKIGQLRQLQKEREEELNSSKLSRADKIILESFLKRIKENEKKKIDLLFLESKRVNNELILKLEISKTKKSIEDAESRYREKKINDSQKERNTLEANKRMQEEKSKRQEREEESERQRRKEESERQRRKEEEKVFQIQTIESRNSGFFSRLFYWLFSFFN